MRENTEHNRQKPKEELAASEEKYREIIENTNGLAFIVDENSIVTFISKSVYNVFGYRQEEILGRSFLEFVPLEDLSYVKSIFSMASAKIHYLAEFRIKTKNRKVIFAKFISTAVYNKSKFAGIMGIAIDISKSKEAEPKLEFQSDMLKGVCEAVFAMTLKSDGTDGFTSCNTNQELIENSFQEAEQGLREILHKSTIIFYSHTPNNIINFVSPNSKKLLGFDPEEVKTRFNELLTDNPVNKKALELTKKAIETGIPQEPYEVELTNNKKETAWFRVHEIPIVKDRKTILMIGSLTDITVRKKAEEELQANQSLLTSALEMAKMGHWEYNLATDTFTFNDQFYKMLRTSIKEMGSYTMSSTEYAKRFVHPDDISFVSPRIGVIESTEDVNISKELEHRIIYADGNIGNIIVRISIVKDRNGKTIRTYGVNQDITKRKSVENELIEAKERAEESNRLKSSFLANMSHELRTPMVGILGFAEILTEQLTEHNHIEMASKIKKSGTRLISTLNSILDLSRIEANKHDINTSPVNLNDLIKEVIQPYKSIIKEKKIFLRYVFSEKDIHLNSDKDLLLKIFNNLINNAVKYTDEGGIIVKLIVQDKEPDKKILVEVTDTGIGIPKEFHKIIFEPFRQVSEGYSRQFEGAGLGLSITKKFIELLNGSLTLESDQGKGSTFIVTFKYTNIEKEITSPSDIKQVKKAINNNPFNNISVLLVEDDPGNASLISAYLEDYLNIDHVSDGNSAVKVCNSIKYDAVLMDINLKGIDGVETLRQIRKINNHYSNIPIIAITAYAMLGDREKFLSLGFTHYISKPFTRPELLILLTEIFNND